MRVTDRKRWIAMVAAAATATSLSVWAGTTIQASAKSNAVRGPVNVTGTTGTSGAIQGPTSEPVTISLDNATFQQKAGQVLLVAAEARLDTAPDQSTATCDVEVAVAGSPGELGLDLVRLARRGDVTTTLGDSQAIAAPAADRTITLSAWTHVYTPPGSDELTCASDETYSISLRVSIVSLPG